MRKHDDAICACPDEGGVSRRRLLAGAAALAGVGALDLARPTMAFAAGSGADLLVVVTLRGGADGLSLVPPLADPAYGAARPGVGVRTGQALPLDRTFGLHPRMAPLLPYWRNKTLAVVQAVGDQLGSRSHFEATDAMERGSPAASVGSGWIDRHLTSSGRRHELPAFAVGWRTPGTLTGPAVEITVPSVQAAALNVGAKQQPAVERALLEMHAGVPGAVAASGRSTVNAVRRLGPTRRQKYQPRAGVTYPTSDLGNSLREVAQVARAGVGLQVACVDAGGWDTHTGMGSAGGGSMANLVGRFAESLAAFAKDLGPLLRTTTIVTVSEFGRRLAENGSGGVDHGYGNAMLLLGGGVQGGRVYGRWPGLAPNQLDQGDLRVTTDYRDVLGEVVRRRLGNAHLSEVFPGHRVRELGLLSTR